MLVALVSCMTPYAPLDDPVLDVGPLHIGEHESDALRTLGPGTLARFVDDRGKNVAARLYRHGGALLAIVVAHGRVEGIDAFEHPLSQALVDETFLVDAAQKPYVTTVAIDRLTWLGGTLFSSAIASPPPNWRVPTDFTIARSDKSFYIVRDDNAASKEHTRDFGWVVRVR